LAKIEALVEKVWAMRIDFAAGNQRSFAAAVLAVLKPGGAIFGGNGGCCRN
jgi:hypothetical protein